MRRHPFGVGAAALIAVLVIGFGATMAWQANRLAEERDRASHEAQLANESTDFLLQLFIDSDPLVLNPAELSALDLLNTAAERLPDSLASDPMVRARLMERIGMAFAALGDFEQSVQIQRDALEITVRETGEDSEETMRARYRLGSALGQNFELDEAEALLRESIAWLQRNGPGDIGRADAYNALGIVQRNLARYEDAEQSLRESIRLRIERDGESSLQLGAAYYNLARTLRSLRRFDEARSFAIQSLENQRQNGGAPARIGLTLSQLADIERNLGMLDEAEANAREGLAMYIEVYGEENHQVTLRMDSLAQILYAQGENQQVLSLFERAMDIHRAAGTVDQPPGARTMMSYGRFLLLIEEVEQARPLIKQAHRIASEFHQADGVAMRFYDRGLQQLRVALEPDPAPN
jgi:tetratricopeptide (TPR) repeat protein